MGKQYEELLTCYKSLQSQVDFSPKAGLVLGSGLGDYAEEIEIAATLPYEKIEGFPVSTVSGHKGQFVFGHIGAVPVVIMQGRVHYYEGYPMDKVVLPIRLMKMMGISTLFLTNAAGGLDFDFSAGDFMLIKDQIANFVPSPLIGPNEDELGTRFPDMSEIYDADLRAVIKEAAAELSIPLKEGVYVQLTGPNYESPAEVRMCRALGGNAVGMSTACEAVAANHMGMKICGISCISNLGCGMSDQPLSHVEVKEAADRVAPLFKQLITKSIEKMQEKGSF